MKYLLVKCTHCEKEFEKRLGAVTATIKRNGQHFCSLQCSGASKKKFLSKEEKVRLKADYDREYRDKNRSMLKEKKAKRFKETYDPVAAAVYRKSRMHKHVAYCRRPEYRAKKKEYDRERVAKASHGEFWESALLIREIEQEYDTYQANIQNNTYNKSQKRKRAWKTQQKLDSALPH